MAMKIESCPFCQSQRLHIHHNLLSYAVACETCKAKGPHHRSIDAALMNWNAVALRQRQSRAFGEPIVDGHLDNLEHAVRNLSIVLRRCKDDFEQVEH